METILEGLKGFIFPLEQFIMILVAATFCTAVIFWFTEYKAGKTKWRRCGECGRLLPMDPNEWKKEEKLCEDAITGPS